MTRFGRTDKDLYLILDTETSGFLPKGRLVQIAAAVVTEDNEELSSLCMIVKPDGWFIPAQVEDIHGISTEQARKEGLPLAFVLKMLNYYVFMADAIIGHNIKFDMDVLSSEYQKAGMLKDKDRLFGIPKVICTMKTTTKHCAIPKARGKGYKWPKLEELYQIVTGKLLEDAHGALPDLNATREVFFQLREEGVIEVT